MTPLLMYTEIASWWPLLSSAADYEDEATYYAAIFDRHSPPTEHRALLELGSGGGNNASWLKRSFAQVTLVDLSPAMLDVSRALNPDCEHHVGDMRSVRLGRTFDCVFVHDAICYATTLDDLKAVFDTARAHARPGGVALFTPDFVRETFRIGTEHGGHDDGARGLRYLEWTFDPDPTDTTYVVDYAYLLRERDGTTRTLHDRHLEGLFPIADWMHHLGAAGFEAHLLRHRFSDVDWESVHFLGKAI
ncbi:MAG: class I SAM-dependent methyltransferase [Gemmatimonadetes bacterium]|nr:class I SAM-dependent methyltransferase [Gemmatimonadota bacterium]